MRVPSPHGNTTRRPTSQGCSTSCRQNKSKDSEDLVQGQTHEGRWSYVHKILDGDMFCYQGIVTPHALICGYKTWQSPSSCWPIQLFGSCVYSTPACSVPNLEESHWLCISEFSTHPRAPCPLSVLWAFKYIKYSGETYGEMIETSWAEQNQTAGSTKEQNGSHRHDTLNDFFGYWNWTKYHQTSKSHHIDLTTGEAKSVNSCYTYAAVQSHLILDEDSGGNPTQVVTAPWPHTGWWMGGDGRYSWADRRRMVQPLHQQSVMALEKLLKII